MPWVRNEERAPSAEGNVAADLDAIDDDEPTSLGVDDDEPTSLGVSSNRHSHTLSSCARPPRPIRFAYTGGCGAREEAEVRIRMFAASKYSLNAWTESGYLCERSRTAHAIAPLPQV